MNSKNIIVFFKHGLWMIPIFILSALPQYLSVFPQEKEKSNQKLSYKSIRTIDGLEIKDVKFILDHPLSPQYENKPYDGPKINPKSSYKKSIYEKDSINSRKVLLKKRVELAISYREKGDIDQFNSILLDVITQNNFNEEAAWAALLLGDFELLLYNLQEAMKYYIYVVNVHYYSGFGTGGMYKMAEVLDKNANWKKAEELLVLILDSTQTDNLIWKEAGAYLKRRYLERVRWHYERGEDEKVKEYFIKYQNLNSVISKKN